ncbi:MAG: hypothetical protein ABSH52_12810 [Terriglobia bacterium]
MILGAKSIPTLNAPPEFEQFCIAGSLILIVTTVTRPAGMGYGFPANDVIRPAVKLADLVFSSFDPSDKIREEGVIGVAAVSLRLMAYLCEVRGD